MNKNIDYVPEDVDRYIFPGCRNGFWTFAGFTDSYVSGIKIMGWFEMPRSDTVILQNLVHTKGGSIELFNWSPMTEASFSEKGLEVKLGDYYRLSGKWPNYKVFVLDRENDVEVKLDCRCQYVKWWLNNYYSAFDARYNGEIKIREVTHKVKGIGAFEHGFTEIGQRIGPGIGFWHYEPLMWNDKYASIAWFWVNLKGEIALACGAGTLLDGKYCEFDSCEVKYLKSRDFGAEDKVTFPARWKILLSGKEGSFEYTASLVSVSEKRYKSEHKQMAFGMNPYIEAEGLFKSANGKVSEMKGCGTSELVRPLINPLEWQRFRSVS